jgi:N-methylhydantoinase A/oxoprolinase/acetone carboxylase beta subunit
VLSALGLVASDERRDSVRSFLLALEEAGELPSDGEADLRYEGQSFELTVPLQEDLAQAFHRAHELQYGFAERGRKIELVAIRTAEVRRAPPIGLRPMRERSAIGPAIVELPGATAWVPAGWRGATDPHGTLVLRRQ